MSTKVEQLVKIRKRKLPSGNYTLFLDYSDKKQGRIRETLGLSLMAGTSLKIKEANRETMVLAEERRLKKERELVFGKQKLDNIGLKTPFLAYFRNMIEERRESNGNWGNWRSCLRYLEKYCTEDTTFEEIDTKWVAGFKNYLEFVEKDTYKKSNDPTSNGFNGLSQNSKLSYFNKLRACLNRALRERIIEYNPAIAVDNFKADETERPYLTEDEVKALVSTECKYYHLKRAFLFACFTGLRKSDIQQLTWGDIKYENGRTRIIFRQKKTRGLEYLDIPRVAEQYIGERGDAKLTDLVFQGFHYSAQTSIELRRWGMKAGIQTDFTFHCSRHTFALLLLNSGADIYTVSKLLGHREIKTTQIYSHILDKKKQDAVEVINVMFGNK